MFGEYEKPALSYMLARMKQLGLPFIEPTCTDYTWQDAVDKVFEAVVHSSESIRTYCPLSLWSKLMDLQRDLRPSNITLTSLTAITLAETRLTGVN